MDTIIFNSFKLWGEKPAKGQQEQCTSNQIGTKSNNNKKGHDEEAKTKRNKKSLTE